MKFILVLHLNKYGCQMDNNCECNLTLQWHLCTVSKVFGINDQKKTKQIFLANKEYLTDLRYKRTNIDTKCKLFVTVIENFIGISIAYRYTGL